MKILIADDEAIERTTLRDILRDEPGIEIIESGDGRDALDLLCDGLKPDLCLIDIRMPRIDGMEMLQRMRRDPMLKNIKVVIASSNRDKNVILSLAQLNISGYLLKPYDETKVKATLGPLIKDAVLNRSEPPPVSRNLLAKTLLVVDDEEDGRQAIRKVVEAEGGWEILEAKSGDEALVMLREGLRPTLCFANLDMAGGKGVVFIKNVREALYLNTLPIVVLSAEPKVGTIKQLAAYHVAGFLVQPVDSLKIRAFLRHGQADSEENAENQAEA